MKGKKNELEKKRKKKGKEIIKKFAIQKNYEFFPRI